MIMIKDIPSIEHNLSRPLPDLIHSKMHRPFQALGIEIDLEVGRRVAGSPGIVVGERVGVSIRAGGLLGSLTLGWTHDHACRRRREESGGWYLACPG